ncbi:MAG TPA: S8 family peptidase [Acidimicrobiales bacterium]
MRLEDFEAIFRPEHTSAGPHTLDSPIRYEVWREYARNDGRPVDLLLEPEVEAGPTLLAALGRACMEHGVTLRTAQPAMVSSLIAVELPFDAFLEIVVSLTPWRDLIVVGQTMSRQELQAEMVQGLQAEAVGASATERRIALPDEVDATLQTRRQDLIDRFRWFCLLVSRIGYLDGDDRFLFRFVADPDPNLVTWLATRFARAEEPQGEVKVRAVSLNRRAIGAVQVSRNTVKADAAARVFDLSCAEIGWAVLDSGIDARHWAFRQLDDHGRPVPEPVELVTMASGQRRYVNRTRIENTFDLTRAREHFAGSSIAALESMRLEERLLAQKIDLFPPGAYRPPANDHGTHVAGILAADWREARDGEVVVRLQGVCPDLRLWDLRVLNELGQGDEFSVVAGLRLVQAINRRAGRRVIHGVNLSISIAHHVANYACGWTPVCKACNDLVDSGVVVVAAAGNSGFVDRDGSRRSLGAGYQSVSITDPGNAEQVITVGATHASLPHRYGTSYFSARGPTADGRRKPDLLAPGEGITGPIPLVQGTLHDAKSYDGTSQAAPHVSGAAALLLARYPELRGDPQRVKQILTSTATDLGREPYFQGGGLVDILRALQSQ